MTTALDTSVFILACFMYRKIGGEWGMAKKSMNLGDYCSCCTSWSGLIHVVAGIGVGLLLVHYLSLTDVALYGWGLVVVGLLGHFVGKKGWK